MTTASKLLSGAAESNLDRLSAPRGIITSVVSIVLSVLALLCSGCHQLSPSDLPAEEPWILAIKSARLPDSRPWIARLAHHTWFDIKRGDEEQWMRIEVADVHDGVGVFDLDGQLARSDERFDRDVHLIRHWTGAEAERLFRALEGFAANYEDDGNYRPFPGPNSNAFAARAMLAIDGLSGILHHNSFGKDYTPYVRVGGTTSGTGVALETIPFGIALGIEEGVELHLIQMTFGISAFPPALKIPFAPTIGF